MMNIIKKYEYLDFDNIDDPETGKRVYACPDGSFLPSVTTILSETKDYTFLNQWRGRIGDEEADRQVKEAINVGNLMHKSVEQHILGEERKIKGNLVHRKARQLADRIIARGLSSVDEVWGIEVPLYFPGAYAGRTDLVGQFDGEPSVMDHKNSKKIKKEEWVEDYYYQGCAYCLAHNEMYGSKIHQVVLFMASREDDDYKTFILNGAKFDDYTDKWIRKLETFMINES